MKEPKYDDVFTSRAILDLHGFFVITNDMDIIDDPKIIFNGLRPDELYLLDYISKLNQQDRNAVYEELVRDNVIEIFGHTGKTISLIYSPAGIIEMIAEAVLQITYDYLINKDDSKFETLFSNITYLENMQAIIAHYLSIPHPEVCKYSINEIYKKYALCAQTFPHQVQPLQRKE